MTIDLHCIYVSIVQFIVLVSHTMLISRGVQFTTLVCYNSVQCPVYVKLCHNGVVNEIIIFIFYSTMLFSIIHAVSYQRSVLFAFSTQLIGLKYTQSESTRARSHTADFNVSRYIRYNSCAERFWILCLKGGSPCHSGQSVLTMSETIGKQRALCLKIWHIPSIGIVIGTSVCRQRCLPVQEQCVFIGKQRALSRKVTCSFRLP